MKEKLNIQLKRTNFLVHSSLEAEKLKSTKFSVQIYQLESTKYLVQKY